MIHRANCRRVLLALAVLLGAFLLLLPTSAQASDVLTSDDGKWSLAECEGGVEVTAYHGDAADVYVPASVAVGGVEYTVVKLADSLFENNDGLNSVTLGTSILEVGAKAFYDCDNLVCVLLSESTTTLGAEAFSGCDSFNSIILYDAVTAIGDSAFADCPSLTVWCNENNTGYSYAVENSIPYQLLSTTATPEIVTLDGIEYYIMNGQAIAVSFDGSTTTVTIPATVEGHPVTELRETFKDSTAITAVTLPSGLKTIGANAFYGCTSLQNVLIPHSVTSIGEHAFNGCTNLAIVNLPNGITEIPNYAFHGCKSLSAFELPNTVTSIGNYAFCQCKQIESITFPLNLTDIGENAFHSSGLTSIQFPSQITQIKIGTFRNCDSLTTVSIPEGITTVGSDAFSYCGSLTSVSLPSTVKIIGGYSFEECPNLTNISIAEGTEKIGRKAFANCPKLLTVTLPESILEIGTDTFRPDTFLLVHENSYAHSFAEENYFAHCISDGNNDPLIYSVDGVKYYIENDCAIAFYYDIDNYGADVVIPAEVEGYPVTEILNAFYHKYIQSITMADSVTKIAPKAFYNCVMLKSVDLSDSLLEIPENAFYFCTGLTSVSMPSSLETIGANAFSYCRYLNVQLPNTVTSIGESAFYDTRFSADSLPEKLTVIKKTTFNGCKSLVNLTIPNGVTTIEEGAFANTGLTSVIIPNSVTTIGKNAFSQISTLISIVVPESVTSISSGAFDARTALLVYENSYAHTYAVENDLFYFLYDGVTPVEIYSIDSVNYVIEDNCAIAYCYTGTSNSVTIPAAVNGAPVTEIGSIFTNNTYLHTVTIPDTVTTISNRAFLGCSFLTQVTLSANLKAISGGLFLGCSRLRAISIPSSVQTISSSAFSNCSNLSRITMPDSLVSIGASAFNGCSALKEITIPNGVTSIERSTFYLCTNLTTVVLPDTLKSIGASAFGQCTHLESIIIPDSVTSIESEAFYYCTNLSSVSLSKSLTHIGQSAFTSCNSLSNILLPDSLEVIGNNAFMKCTAMTNIVIPEKVVEIPDAAFQDCSSLFSIVLPESLIKIGNQSFCRCASLVEVVIPESVQTIGNFAFQDCDSLVTLSIPDSVTSIGGAAFRNCDNLRIISIPASVTKIGSIPFTASVILLVYKDSYAHTFAVENDLLYFVIRETENPEIAYGAGISGTVVYSGGSPAAGVSVEILYDDGISKETVTTDETGAYSFTYAEVGAYTIRATDASGSTASTAAAVKRMNVFDVFLAGDTDLTLKQGWTVSGTVSESAATVTLTDESGNVLGTAQTTDGSFAFTNIPNGTYILKAETETGSAVQEITVFDGAVSDITLTVSTQSATVWGYVEVEDRAYKHHRRNWVQVTLYNADGTAVSQCKSDTDGAYRFAGLPLGQYTIVAETAEMRPDKKHGFDRSFTLTGYAYVDAAEAKEYQADTIILYEENDYLSSISGKVTANGETQVCEVILRNVFRQEVARCATKNNGKYTFQNVRDGLYIVTATTGSNGMGYTVVAVRHGRVYGETDIKILKADKIKNREDKFKNEVPECGSREEALNHRERIAEEKRFYDGLSEKEKRQLSHDYVDRLNRYSEWIAGCTYETGEGVSVERGGLVVSGDELENAGSVSFKLEVTATEGHSASTDGVHDRDDYIYHDIHHKAGKHEVLQYYDICLYKDVDGTQTQITSVQKDTDAMGKLRITMDIPEEYRGRRHYTIVHEHEGQVVTLTDLDDDPNTVTFEVDRFSTFVLTATDESLAVGAGELGFAGASLTLQHNLTINFKADSALFTEDGYTDPYVVFDFGGVQTTVSSYTLSQDGSRYVFPFQNIAPNQIGQTVTATLYATLNGQLYESQPATYSVTDYCYRMLDTYSAANDPENAYAELRTLLVDLLNYGTLSQQYTGYNTDALANAQLTADQLAWGTGGDPQLSDILNREYTTVDSPTVTWKGAGLSLRDSVAVRLKFAAASTENLTVRMVVGEAEYTLDASQFVATDTEGVYYVYFNQLGAHQMREELYFTVYENETPVSNTLRYSIESYICKQQTSTQAYLAELVMAIIRYGDSAYAYIN